MKRLSFVTRAKGIPYKHSLATLTGIGGILWHATCQIDGCAFDSGRLKVDGRCVETPEITPVLLI